MELATPCQFTFVLFSKILGLEEKVRKLKTDLKRAQDKNKYSDGEVSLFIVDK